jgi:hypothetical protein
MYLAFIMTPLAYQNARKTDRTKMIMKPRLWEDSLEPGCAYVTGTQIDLLGIPECKENQSNKNDYEAQAVGGKFGIRLCICTWHSNRPPWQARMP